MPDSSKRVIWLNVNESAVSMDAQDLKSVPEPFDEYEFGVSVSADDQHRLLVELLAEARGPGTAEGLSKELGRQSDAEVGELLRSILVALYFGRVNAVDEFRERLKSLDIADHFWVYY
ncbi:MAG TPA: hypothetical protein VGS17_07440 [Candidatus Limnocylindria bacterium]|nr:hypothetical protein [Candidatus Limnocylindria bacterium]